MLNAIMRAFKQKLIEEKLILESQKQASDLAVKQIQNKLEAAESDHRTISDDLLREVEGLESQLGATKDKQ